MIDWQIDWWFIADVQVADGAISMDESYGELVHDVRHKYLLTSSHSRTSISMHYIWGVHFLARQRLRARCAVGHLLVAYYHFTLARYHQPVQASDPNRACRAYTADAYAQAAAVPAVGPRHEPDVWRPVWWPGGADASCAAEDLPGYALMCPLSGLPAQQTLVIRCPNGTLPGGTAASPRRIVRKLHERNRTRARE